MCECVWSELKIASSATNPGSYCYLLTNNIPLSLISGLWVRTSGAGCLTEHNTHQSVPGPAQVSVGLHTSRRVSQTFPTSCGGVFGSHCIAYLQGQIDVRWQASDRKWWSVSYTVHLCRSCACPLVQAICPNRFASKPDRHRNGITNDKMQAPKNKMFSTLTRSERLITIRLKFRSPFVCSVHFSSHMYVRLGKRETESDPVRCCVSVSMLFFHPISVRPYLGTRVSTVRYLAHARALFTPRLHSPAPSWHDAERREWSILPAIDNFRCKAVFLQTVQSAHRPHYSNGYTVKGAQSHTHTHGRNPTHTHTRLQ